MPDKNDLQTEIMAGDAAAPVGPYPHARRVGELLFMSGIGPRRPGDDGVPGLVRAENGRPVEYDFTVQCHAVFDNIHAVLRAAALDWRHIVDVTAFLIDMPRDFEDFNRVYGHYLGEARPCRTTVEVSRLPTPIAVELKCIARFAPAELPPAR